MQQSDYIHSYVLIHMSIKGQENNFIKLSGADNDAHEFPFQYGDDIYISCTVLDFKNC